MWRRSLQRRSRNVSLPLKTPLALGSAFGHHAAGDTTLAAAVLRAVGVIVSGVNDNCAALHIRQLKPRRDDRLVDALVAGGEQGKIALMPGALRALV